MRSEARNLRSLTSRHLQICAAAVCASTAIELGTNALANVLELKPIFSVEQIFTDNVRGDSQDRDADGVTILMAGLQAKVRSSRINAAVDVNFFYNEFWATNSLDNLNGGGTVAARGEVVENFFFVDAVAEKRDVYLSSSDVSASGLATGQGGLRQTNYGVSPFVSSDVFGFADLLVRANYAEVQFDKPIVGIASTLLTDIAIKSLGGKITTGDRSKLYEASVTAEHLETDLGFAQRNVIGGLTLHVTKGLSAVGHLGYERIIDPSFPLIRGPVWSVGGRYLFGNDEESFMQFEYGRRFDDKTYSGEVNVVLRPGLRVVGKYADRFVPIQLTLVRGLDELLDQAGNFTFSPPNGPNRPDPTIVDAIVRDKDARLSTTFDKDLQSYALTIGLSDRFYPSLLDNVRYYFVAASLYERLSRNLDYLVDISYQNNYEVLATGDKSQVFRAELTFTYQYARDVAFAGGYGYRLETNSINKDSYENVLRFSVSQAF